MKAQSAKGPRPKVRQSEAMEARRRSAETEMPNMPTSFETRYVDGKPYRATVYHCSHWTPRKK
jgi:hypothetical protein